MGLGGRSVALKGTLQTDSKNQSNIVPELSRSIIAGEKYVGMEDAVHVVFLNAFRH